MKSPAQSWTAACPDSRFTDLPLDIQEIVTAAYWLGAAEALSAIVCGEVNVVDQIEDGARGGETRH